MTTAERSRQLGVATVVVAAGAEVVTALVLIIRPALFGWLLFGTEFSPSGLALGRLAGFALLALALACWPGSGRGRKSAIGALVTFSLLSAIYLVCLGVTGGLVGPLLWPAAAMHAALTIILIRDWFKISQLDAVTVK
jgi:hypothetical protein